MLDSVVVNSGLTLNPTLSTVPLDSTTHRSNLSDLSGPSSTLNRLSSSSSYPLLLEEQSLSAAQTVYNTTYDLPIVTGQSLDPNLGGFDTPFDTIDTTATTDALIGSGKDAALVGTLSTTISDNHLSNAIGSYNDSLWRATNFGTLRGNISSNNQISNNDPGDFFMFQLDTASNLNITLTGMMADADLYLFQDFNGNGVYEINETIGYSNLYGNASESISLQNQAPGNYYVYVDRYSGRTNYTLSLTSDGAGDMLPTARDLGFLGGGVVSDFVSSGDRSDVYRFHLDTTSDVNLNLTGLSGDADLYLIQDFNGNNWVENNEILSYSTAAGSSPEAIAVNGLLAGTYYVQVLQYNGATNYDLGLLATPTEPGESLGTAAELGSLAGQISVSEIVGNFDSQDVYRFSLNTTSDLNLNLTGLSADADLFLIRDFNNNGLLDSIDTLANSRAAGITPEAISINGLSAGNYFAVVQQYIGDTSYTLTLTADAAGETLFSARNLGSLNSSVSLIDYVGISDPLDYYRFSLNTLSNLSVNLQGLTADADIFLIQDFNNNGIAESWETLAFSNFVGSSPETINLNGLAAGNYFVAVNQYSGNTNYLLNLSAESVGGLRTQAGTLWADTFTYVPGFSYTVFSGNGNVNFGEGGRDFIDLSNQFSNSITFNLATATGGGVLFDPGNGTRVFDAITLNNGNQILFEGIDSIAFADTILNLSVIPNDPLFSEQWNLHMMDVHNAWRFTTGSSNVLIGVQDTGLGVDSFGNIHPDLRTNTLILNSNYTDESLDPSHGTAVQGIIATETNNGFGISGINWNSPVFNIDVLDGNWEDLDLFQGTQTMINQALLSGQRLIINLSLRYTANPFFEQLVSAYQDSVLFVIASGNEDNSNISYPSQLANLYSNVIAVGASWGTEDINGNSRVPGTRISYPGIWGSNYGFGLTLMGPSEVPTTEASPSFFGSNFYFEDDFNGTSAATPNVAGVASLVWSVNPNLTAAQVRTILQETAYDLGSPGYDLVYGSGFVNSDAAVRRAIAFA
jgi:serine protease